MNVRQKECVLLGLDEAFGVAPRFGGGAGVSASVMDEARGLYEQMPTIDLMQEVR